ncbi:MAG: hypothetical protein LM581_03025 [Desulfurococcales archaeon]|nr:hypothetical protein [Desulfurococcales archaeon]
MWLSGDTVYISSHSVSEKIRNASKSFRLELYSYYRERLEDLHLYMLISLSKDVDYRSCRWKITLNGVNISRVLKPFREVYYKNKKYILLSYDLTPIKNVADVINDLNIEYWGGEPLNIDYISLLSTYTLYDSGRGDRIVFLDYEPKVLEENSRHVIRYEKNMSGKIQFITVLAPLESNAHIKINDHVYEIKNLEEVVKEDVLLEGISIEVVKGSVLMPLYIIREKIFKEPDLVIKDLEINKTSSEYVVNIYLENRGDISPKEVLAVAINRGRNISIARSKEFSDKIVLTINKSMINRDDPKTTIRVVWDWLGHKYYVSKDLVLEV